MALVLNRLNVSARFFRPHTGCWRNITYQQYVWNVTPVTTQLVNNDIIFNTFTGMLSDIWNGVLWAVPKTRRSIAKRKWLRSFRQLKPRNDIEDCVVCGHKKLMGRLCKNCFSHTMSLTEQIWKEGRGEDGKYRKDRYVR